MLLALLSFEKETMDQSCFFRGECDVIAEGTAIHRGLGLFANGFQDMLQLADLFFPDGGC
jgi:hypothetical protein